MKKNFLLLLLLTLLPLAGWAQTAVWSSGDPDIKYGDALTGIGGLVSVVSSNGNQDCLNVGEGTSYPTGNVNQFYWKIYKGTTAQDASSRLDVGTYTLRLYIRHQNGISGGFTPTYGNNTRDLTFTIKKGEVTVTGYDITKVWDNGVTDPTIADFGANASWRSVSGINGTDDEKWDLVKGYLAFQRVDNGTDVATYKYTFTATGAPTNFDLKFVGGYFNVTQATNVAVDATKVTIANWTYGETASTPANADAFKYGNDKVVYTYSVKGAGNFTDEVPTEAGDYTLKATVPEHLNYAPEVSVEVDFKIEKADPTITVTSVGGAATSPEFTYDAPDFNTANFTYDYDFTGYDGTPDTYAFTKDGNPAAWDGSAGAWTVAVTFTEGSNWNAATTAPFAFTVGKAENEFTTAPAVTTTALTYDTSAKDLLANFATVATKGAGEVQYKVVYTPNEGSAVTGTYAATAPKGTEAGKYEIYCKVLESANYKPIAESKVGEVTIAKATLTVSGVAGKDDAVYTGSAQSILKHGADVKTSYGADLAASEYSVSYTGGETSPVNAYANVKQTNAGEYEVTCQVTPIDLNNFETPAVFGPVKAKIEKAPLDIAAQDIEVDWTGTAIDLPASHYAKGDPTDFVASETEDEQYAIVNSLVKLAWIGEAGNTAIPTDAGYYKFELALVDTDPTPCNYKINNFSPNASLQINKVDATAATVAAATLTYNGGDQALLDVDDTPLAGGEMLYYVGDAAPAVGDSKWSSDVPEETNAGTYKVWYMTKGDKNHNDIAAASVDVEIAQADLAIVVDALTKVYGAADPELTYTITGLQGTDDEETIGFEISRAEGENVGEYDITATVDDTKATNYKVAITNAKLTITQADLAIVVDAQTKVYGAADPELTYKITGLQGTDDEETIGFAISRAEGEDVGEYDITATVDPAKATNYKAPSITNAKLTITQAELVLTAADATKVYEEEDPELTLAEEPAYKNGDNAEKIGLTITREAGEDVGEYEITPAATSANYKYTVYTATFTITKQPVTPTAPTANILTYNGKDQALVAAGSAKGSTIQYALDEGDFGDDVPTAKNAGTYTVKYKFTPGDNFSIAEPEGEFTVKILQAHVAFRMGKQVETYTGEAFTPKEGEAYTLSEGGFFTGDEDVVTFDFLEGFDATTACEEGRAFEKLAYTFNSEVENYTIEFQNQGLLIIKKAAPAEFTAPAANDLTYNGLSQKLVSAGEVSVVDEKPLGTILFSTTEDGTYTEAIPEGTNAGVYNVWYMVKGDANHSDTEPAKVANVEIKPFALFADMIKAETLSKPYTAAVQSFPMSLKVKLAADPKDPRTLVEKQDYTVKINGKEVKDVTIKDAGDYVYTFTGKGNYTGEISTTAKITKLELIATAPNAEKTYDGTAVIEPEEFKCTATQLKLYGGLEISGLLADDKIDLGGKTIADIIVPEGSAINVGTYNLKVNLAAIPVQANYTFNAQTFDGKLTINKAEAVKIGFFTWEEPNTEEAFWGTTIVKTKEYSKSYGTADPVFITEKGTNDVTSISGDLMALEGELFEDNAVVAALLGATRTAGEVYTKDGYTVKLGWKNTSNTAELAKIATFKNNYKNVTFGTTKLNITPFEGTIKVSIKSDAVVFDGKEHADAIAWAADLSNMVVVGMPAGKNKNEIFTELPKITVTPKDGKVRNAGDYNITLSGGKSDNYDMKKVQFVLGSYLTVEPFEITPDMVTIPDQQVKIGDKAKDVIKHDAFTFAEGALPVAEDANLFQVVAAPDFIDANGKIKLGADPAEGLILARKDNTNAEALNYIGYDEVFGYLSIIGTPDLLVLDDTKDIATKDRENTDVTFTNRSIRQDDWNVLCLPFDATIKEISDAFGYAAVDLLKKESVDGSMHFVVTTSGTVPAGEPFIIKPTSDPELNAKSNFVQVKFTGVTVKEFSDNPEPVKDSAGNKFCGTFKAQTTFFGEKFWYMSKSEWKQASNYTEANPVKLGAYRAYIETATAGARIFIEEPDGSITAINAIDLNNNTMDEGWYTVNGMKLNAAPTQKGTYIKDGKKVFVK